MADKKKDPPKFSFKVWTPRTCTVDLSEWMEEPKAPVVLTEADVPGTFNAGGDIEEFRKRNPAWPDRLCALVATLAASHVSPDVGPPGLFYEAMVKECPDAFFAVQAKYSDDFKSRANLSKATEEAKND